MCSTSITSRLRDASAEKFISANIWHIWCEIKKSFFYYAENFLGKPITHFFVDEKMSKVNTLVLRNIDKNRVEASTHWKEKKITMSDTLASLFRLMRSANQRMTFFKHEFIGGSPQASYTVQFYLFLYFWARKWIFVENCYDVSRGSFCYLKNAKMYSSHSRDPNASIWFYSHYERREFRHKIDGNLCKNLKILTIIVAR